MESDTRTSLIRAAEELFALHGFNGASVKDICDKAGVNVSLVSYHFEGKEGLYRACLEAFASQGVEVAERVLELPQSREEFLVRLKMFTEEIVAIHLRHPRQTRILYRECNFEDVAKDFFDRTFRRVFEKFWKFLEAAQEKDFVRKDMDPMLAGTAFFGSISHLAHTDELRKKFFGMTIRDEKFRKKSVEQLTQLFVRGVMT